MRRRQKLKSGDEMDACSRYWRERLYWQRGELKKIKRKINKRFRKEGKISVQSEYMLWL